MVCHEVCRPNDASTMPGLKNSDKSGAKSGEENDDGDERDERDESDESDSDHSDESYQPESDREGIVAEVEVEDDVLVDDYCEPLDAELMEEPNDSPPRLFRRSRQSVADRAQTGESVNEDTGEARQRSHPSLNDWWEEKLSDESLRTAFFGSGHKCSNLYGGKPCHANLWGDACTGLEALRSQRVTHPHTIWTHSSHSQPEPTRPAHILTHHALTQHMHSPTMCT